MVCKACVSLCRQERFASANDPEKLDVNQIIHIKCGGRHVCVCVFIYCREQYVNVEAIVHMCVQASSIDKARCMAWYGMA